jgi:DNA replication protein DnaC
MFSRWKSSTGTEAAFKSYYAFSDGNSTPFLFCYGSVGNGKTFLTEAATIRMLQRGIDAWYYSCASLMSTLHKAIETNSVDNLMAIYQEVPALMLDDWKDLSDWEEGKLGDIIDERYRWHRITCLTSNRPLEELMHRNERVISRFMDTELSTMVLNQGADYRPQKASN